MIPKLIHQTWKERNVASYGKGNMGIMSQNSLLRDYSDCEYKVWTDEELAELIETDEFGYIRDIYNKVGKIKKADIGRLAVVKKFGGMYFDLDFISHKRIPLVFDDEKIKFVGCKHHYNRGVHNAFFGCVPNHPLISKTLSSISEETNFELSPLTHTGPIRLTKVSKESGLYSEIHMMKLDEVGNNKQGPKKKYATHYRKHTW